MEALYLKVLVNNHGPPLAKIIPLCEFQLSDLPGLLRLDILPLFARFLVFDIRFELGEVDGLIELSSIVA